MLFESLRFLISKRSLLYLSKCPCKVYSILFSWIIVTSKLFAWRFLIILMSFFDDICKILNLHCTLRLSHDIFILYYHLILSVLNLIIHFLFNFQVLLQYVQVFEWLLNWDRSDFSIRRGLGIHWLLHLNVLLQVSLQILGVWENTLNVVLTLSLKLSGMILLL